MKPQEAHKNGFIINSVPDKKGDFQAFKLGEIRIQVVDEQDNPLPDVLLSLSAGQFRSNNLTLDDGLMVFANLVSTANASWNTLFNAIKKTVALSRRYAVPTVRASLILTVSMLLHVELCCKSVPSVIHSYYNHSFEKPF